MAAMIKMDRVNSFSPTPSSSFQQPVFYDPSSYPQIDPSLQYETTQTLMTPHGQMVMHMTHAPPHPMSSGQPHYIVEDGITPYHPQMLSHASMQHHHHHQVVSPTDHLDARHNQGLQRNNSLPNRTVMAVNRPMMTRGHSMQVPPRPNGLHRQASLQHPSHRSASPHMMAGDIFDPQPGPGSPVKRPATVAVEAQQYEAQEMATPPFGISPARAMGPPPVQPPRFSPHHQELMITPYGQKTGGEMAVPSSAASSSSSSLSSIHDPTPLDVSDDDNNDDSPTKGPSTTRAMSKMQLNEKNPSTRPTRGQTTIVVRPQRPAAAAIAANTNPNIVKPGVGGRTSAKFAKVAEDPGVEGIPPGPRSMDRPGPSFACIIGQAILRCKAGGLSLEHIYRYVETAYPFFKNDNPAWRNSVRHNLSIHKMFATIARTEKFPPGKGGIWIIHEDEKCHWPEDNKFIKNFPSSHPHYAVCRQTLHDREKEQAQMEKAAKEGRVYIPKKGKKGRKLPGEDGVDMVRTSSETGEMFGMSGRSVTPVQFPEQEGEEEGEFLPLEEEAVVVEEVKPEPETVATEVRIVQTSGIVPPRFERKEKKRLLEDEENVFVTTKRVRMTEPMPLAPISIPQDQVVLDDTFITPERERPASNSGKLMSSAFKTPALVNTSSSPGSSPMPPTITRTTHHPSALAQAWTHDDMAATVESSPQRPMLESAFDFQPKQPKPRMRAVGSDEDVPVVNAANPPKTPLTRSSAAREIHKTPGNMLHKSPLTFGRSPAQPPPSISALLSTPMWEMGGCLDRMKDQGSSPTHPIRSPMPPTSPTRYAMLLGSSASPSSKRLREFSV